MRCPACDHDNFDGTDLCASCGLDLAGLDVKAWGIDPEDPILAQRLDRMPIKDALEVSPETPVSEAIHRMVECQEGCVFVTESGKLLGVFTERDVATRLAARDRDPATMTVDQVMTRNPVTVFQGDRLAFALHRMGVDGFRHLPVLDREGTLAGFLSIRAVLSVLAATPLAEAQT